MEQNNRRQQNGKPSEKTTKKEEKEEDSMPSLAKLSLEDGHEKAKSAPGDGKHDGKKPKRGFEDLRPAVRDTLNECFAKLNLLPSDLDPSIYDSLLDFPDPIQCEIVASFCRADLASIRNKTGYFIGILKQYRKNGKALAGAGYPAVYNALPLMNQQAAYLYPYANLYSAAYPPYSPYYGAATVNQAPLPYQQQVSQQQQNGKGGLNALPLSIQAKFRSVFASGEVSESEIDHSIYDSLQDFDEFTQSTILDRFASTKFSKVRNKTGYFISLLKLARQARAADMGFADAAAVTAAGGGYYPYLQSYTDQLYNSVYASPYLLPQPALSPSFSKICLKAQIRLAHLYNTHVIRRTDLEDCVFDSLADFPDNEQLKMCDGFAQANLANVRNKTAFFIGILKRHRHGPAAASAPDGAAQAPPLNTA